MFLITFENLKNTMNLKFLLFTFVISFPILLYLYLTNKKTPVDNRRILSYFLFGSWFGMCGEVFLDTIINKILKVPIPLWEYRILPIHDAATSSFGPIMWGLASIAVCLFHHYSVKNKLKNLNKIKLFFIESGFLMIAELFFDISGYFIFDEYFFYYFSPEFLHFSALVNVPFWWCGYKIIVKASDLLYKEEKLNFTIAILMIIILLWGF